MVQQLPSCVDKGNMVDVSEPHFVYQVEFCIL